MKRRDLKDEMRVVVCTRPWARRVIRKSNFIGLTHEGKWDLIFFSVSSCLESIVCRPHEYWDYVDGEIVQVEKSKFVRLNCKRIRFVPTGRKKTRKEVDWIHEIVKPLEILCTWEEFEPLKEETELERAKFFNKWKECGQPPKFFTED